MSGLVARIYKLTKRNYGKSKRLDQGIKDP